jgi:hypothetical protein
MTADRRLCSPSDRAHVMPMVKAIATVGWCGLAQQACHGGAVVGEHTAAVQARRRCRGRPAGGVREPRRSQSRSGVVIMREFFLIRVDRRGAATGRRVHQQCV